MPERTEKTAKTAKTGPVSLRPGRAALAVEGVLCRLGDETIGSLYEVVRQGKTRRYALMAPKRVASVEVQYTLLGIELKIGRRRLLCPDVATARFLSVFARLGVDEVAVPYDITQVARLADLFESAWQQMLVALEAETSDMTARMKGRTRNLLLSRQRQAITRAGAGPQMPQFDQSTSQRRRK